MRDNQPITTREIQVPEGQLLVSRTDLHGRIVFANDAFVEVSGFSEQELIGQPHNIVRHPHMPPAAFADLWATLKAGQPWDGLVKNRRKDGGFYWVRANVTPLVENGETTGYISIRQRPTQAEVAQAERAYDAIKAGRGNFVVRQGQVFRSGFGARAGAAVASITGRLALAFALLIALLVVAGGIALRGMQDSNEILRTVYADRVVPLAQLAAIGELSHTNTETLIALGERLRADHKASADNPVRTIRANLVQIERIWTEYLATYLTPEEKVLADRFSAAHDAYVRNGLDIALRLAGEGDVAALERQIHAVIPPLFLKMRDANAQLVELQTKVVAELKDQANSDFRLHLLLTVGILSAAVVGAILLGAWLLATLRRPLRGLEQEFTAIAQGRTDAPIPLPAAREFHGLVRYLRAMRARLTFGHEERIQHERDAARDRRRTVQDMAETVETETKLAVERVAEQTGRMAAEAREMNTSASRVSSNATSVAAAAEEALANAQAVSAASEELTASINEIAAQVAQASAVAARAVEGGELAQQRIRSLSESASRIGDVVQLISSIAGQTNLLALNATIEAARAGDAGKGFAVVASEVKGLATQTARSTEEISRQIAEIQSTTGAVVEVVDDIGARIQELAQVSVAVAAAVEQQASATQEIARNVTQTGAAAQEVAQRISEVSADAGRTGDQAALVQTGSDDIARTIETLGGSIVRMIRTATHDADRRRHVRHVIDSAASITGPDGKRHEGRLHDISRGGAMLQGVSGLAPGQRLSLVAHGLGADCRADCHVAETSPDGGTRLLLIEGTETPGLLAAFKRFEAPERLSA